MEQRLGVGHFGIGTHLDEAAEHQMEQRAALGSGGVAQQRIERRKRQHMPGIDRVGVAPQSLDLGDRKLPRPRLDGRDRPRPPDRPGLAGVEAFGPGDQLLAATAHRRSVIGADEGGEALQPARGARRRTAGADRAGKHDMLMPRRHHEVVCREADPALRRLQLETALHQARHEAVGFGLARPDPLVEPADDEHVDGLQPGLQRAPDGDAAVGSRRRLDDLGGNEGGDDVGPVSCVDLELGRRSDERAQEIGEFLAGVAVEEAVEAACLIARECFECGCRGARNVDDPDRAAAAIGDQRLQRLRQAAEHGACVGKRGLVDALKPERLALPL